MLSIVEDCSSYDDAYVIVKTELQKMHDSLEPGTFEKVLGKINEQFHRILWIEHYGDYFLFSMLSIMLYNGNVIVLKSGHLFSSIIHLPDDFDYAFLEGVWYEI